MAKTTEFKQLVTPESMVEIIRETCKSDPAYHGKLAAERKLSELQARLHSIIEREAVWRSQWALAHSAEGRAKANSDVETYLDQNIIPASKSLVESLQKEKADLRDEETLLKGAIELQKWRVMEAKNAYLSAVMPQLRAMHKPVFRQYLADCLAMNKKTEAIRAISDEGERWELSTGGFHAYIPWIKSPGLPTDAQSGLQVSLRGWVEDGIIAESERVNMLQGGEFIP